ncbi:MAG: hypothetical protein LUD12_13310 [Lachnospiraceae bacterium]|nr:hypothetical protein [Lachnospiraceae bacterium]
MTNQEAIETLEAQVEFNEIIGDCFEDSDSEEDKARNERIGDAFRLAIAALEKQEREKWHVRPFKDDYPDDDRLILVSFSNAAGVDVARYREEEQGGAFYPGDDDESYKSNGVYVYAWRELPEEPPVEVSA